LNNIPDPLYHQIIEAVPIACVDIAIAYNGAILLVKRNDPPAAGRWWLPGGRVHKGEMMRDTAIRKAWEEVGIRCHAGPIIYTAETIFPDGPGGIPIHSINSCFFMYPVNGRVIPYLDNHHSEFEWVQHIGEELHPYVKACLKAAGLEND
jgi:colanic acid biosynthesis protein WcaH